MEEIPFMEKRRRNKQQKKVFETKNNNEAINFNKSFPIASYYPRLLFNQFHKIKCIFQKKFILFNS